MARELGFNRAGVLEIELVVLVVDDGLEIGEPLIDLIIACVDGLDEGFHLNIRVVYLLSYRIQLVDRACVG